MTDSHSARAWRAPMPDPTSRLARAAWLVTLAWCVAVALAGCEGSGGEARVDAPWDVADASSGRADASSGRADAAADARGGARPAQDGAADVSQDVGSEADAVIVDADTADGAVADDPDGGDEAGGDTGPGDRGADARVDGPDGAGPVDAGDGDAAPTDGGPLDSGDLPAGADGLEGPEDVASDDGGSGEDAGPAEVPVNGLLGLPLTDADGQPVDVGLLAVGGDVMVQGDWPSKLAASLGGGRNYAAFRIALMDGDGGGLVWSRLFFEPGTPEWHRLAAVPSYEWCEDGAGVRWSRRRAMLARATTGVDPVPASCGVGEAWTEVTALGSCTWHDEDGAHTETAVPFKTCWEAMDHRIALVVDTSAAAWPVDDTDEDGVLDALEPLTTAWLSPGVVPAATACPDGSSADLALGVDWDCSGAVGPEDAATALLAGWQRALAMALLDDTPGPVEHVFVGARPARLSQTTGCVGYPYDLNCGLHLPRTPDPWRPFTRFFHPPTYWESFAVDRLLAQPDLDPRVHPGTADPRAAWDALASCYQLGHPAEAWSLPASSGVPVAVTSDDGEMDGAAGTSTQDGCLAFDHVRLNQGGGWVMADTWFAEVAPYFAGP